MEYGVGRIGRIIVVRLNDGEDVYANIEGIAAKEKVACAAVFVVGGLRRGKVVVGPKNPTGPIEPIFREFDDAREIAGVGTLFCKAGDDGKLGEPSLHMHGAIGRGDETIAGCPRGGATVFCVLEIVIIEIDGLDAARRMDPELGLMLLRVATGR
ncbi:MAG: DUF296 domain-containing protein [Candidatus Paceibacterota bacterium]|jgi:predicted DNA-binding protein with PD1-like motif